MAQGVLGPTIIRTPPGGTGIEVWYPRVICDGGPWTHCDKALTSLAPSDDRSSKLGLSFVTTDNPHGPPPAATVHGSLAYGRISGGGAFSGVAPADCCVGHLALTKTPQIKFARNDASGALASYRTSYDAGDDISFTDDANFSTSIDLGRRNCSICNSACFWCSFASAICLPVSNRYRLNASSAAAASRLWEIIDPAVVTPIAVATSAAAITDIISQKSHHSPLWPRNRVEAAAFALLIVSVIGGFHCIDIRRPCAPRIPDETLDVLQA
jgi:hypothetical protein